MHSAEKKYYADLAKEISWVKVGSIGLGIVWFSVVIVYGSFKLIFG